MSSSRVNTEIKTRYHKTKNDTSQAINESSKIQPTKYVTNKKCSDNNQSRKRRQQNIGKLLLTITVLLYLIAPDSSHRLSINKSNSNEKTIERFQIKNLNRKCIETSEE